jgi:SAM-dependent methyltransferase
VLSDLETRTLAYYDQHADEFLKSTVNVDMNGLYEPFLAGIPAQGRILDAGCGSGRDTDAFLKMGYSVVSIDAAPKMVEATTNLTGQSALLMRFDELAFENEFDGVWACASLLHVPRIELPRILSRLARALRSGGVLFVSFKYGDVEHLRGDRFFNDMNEDLVRQYLDARIELQPFRVWTTEDVRPERRGEVWLNALARKKERDVR